jgi:hypothetical protein
LRTALSILAGVLIVFFAGVSMLTNRSPMALLRDAYEAIKPDPVLLRAPLINGDTLVVHAILHNDEDEISLRESEFKKDFRGDKFLLSSVGEGLPHEPWKEIKGIQVTDKYRQTVMSTVMSFHVNTGSRERSGDFPEDHEVTADSTVMCECVLPKVETDSSPVYQIIDNKNQVIGTFVSPYPAEVPAAGFYDHVHHTEVTTGNWSVRFEECDIFIWKPSSDRAYNSTRQLRIQPKLFAEYDGKPMIGEVSFFDTHFVDALGNVISTSYSESRSPDQQPLWKLKTNVARTDFFTPQSSPELKRVGRIENADLQQTIFLEDESPIGLVSYVGIGQHELHFPYVENIRFKDLFRGHGGNPSQLPKCMKTSGGGRGGNESFWERSASYMMTRSSEMESAVVIKVSGQKTTGTQTSVDSKYPLVFVELKQPLAESVLNLFAYDDSKRQIPLSSLEHDLPTLPVYLIESYDDTKFIDLYYAIEPVVPLEMFVVPPTQDLQHPTNKEDLISPTLVPTEDGWKPRE